MSIPTTTEPSTMTTKQHEGRKRKRSNSPDDNATTIMDPVAWLQEFQPCETTTNFTSPTEQMIASYTMKVMTAARTGELEALKAIEDDLDCSNRFGESLLHFCCRRGYVDMVKYLMEDRKSTISIVDDSNRNILHFACWTAEPNVELVAYLLQQLPIAYVFAKDIRGHTPFDYVRQEHWSVWLKLLQRHRHLFEAAKQPRLSSQ